MMRCLSVAAVGLSLIMASSVTANAADLYGGSFKDEPPPAPFVAPFRWTGFYLGGNVGGAWARGGGVRSNCTPQGVCDQLPASGNVDADSFIGGVHAGYNWSVSPLWLIGIEGDFEWTQLEGSASAADIDANGDFVAAGGHTWSRDINWLASVRARLGYTVSPKMLLFFTGGVAWQDADYSATQTQFAPRAGTASTSFSETTTGYVLGGGLEWAMTKNWILKGEYLYYNFDGQSSNVSNTQGAAVRSSFKWDDSEVHSLRAGISYKF